MKSLIIAIMLVLCLAIAPASVIAAGCADGVCGLSPIRDVLARVSHRERHPLRGFAKRLFRR